MFKFAVAANLYQHSELVYVIFFGTIGLTRAASGKLHYFEALRHSRRLLYAVMYGIAVVISS